MRIRKQTKVTGTHTTEVIFGSVVGGIIVSIGFGPVAGILAAASAFAFGYPAAKKEANEEANQLIQDDLLEDDLLNVMMRNGRGTYTVKTELKNIHPNQPPLGRIFIGDKLIKETKYYLED